MRILLLALLLVIPVAQAGVIFPGPGWQAILSTDFHQVSGTVTVIDADTIMVDGFVYDSQGIDVYFYLGADDSFDSFNNGLQVGPQLVGTVFDGTGPPIVIDLPVGRTIEGFGAIAVWCTVVPVSFGSGTFAPVPEPSGALLLGGAGLLAVRRRRSPGRTSRRPPPAAPL